MPDEYEQRAIELLEDYKNAKSIDDKDDILIFLSNCNLAVLTYIVDLALENQK